jgi:16S rRNA (guanine527-N7)-methyltransferase
MTPGEFMVTAGVTDAVIRDLEILRDLVLSWNDRINLVGPSFQLDFWRRHALDSAQLFHVEQQAVRWADVGAGAGFPGVVLAILLKARPAAEVHLVESLGKRVRFLETVCREIDVPVVIHHDRAENLRPAPVVDIVTARACAPLVKLFGYTQGFFKQGARGLFLKGKAAEQEVREAGRSWSFVSDLLPSRSDPEGRMVRISKLAFRG